MSKTAHNTPKIAFALSTALVSVALAGCTTSAAPPASASLAKAQAAIEKGKAAKAVEYAEIKGQGRVPYGKSVDVKVPTTMKRMTARGMGAAVKGGGYMGCE